MHGDSIHPSLQSAVASEIVHFAKDLEKDFLNDVGSFGRVVQLPVDEAEDGTLVGRDELIKSGALSTLEPPDESRFRVRRRLVAENRGHDVYLIDELGLGDGTDIRLAVVGAVDNRSPRRFDSSRHRARVEGSRKRISCFF